MNASTSGYYLWFDDQKHGPYSASDVTSMQKSGEIPPGAFYWADGMEDWQSIAGLLSVQKNEVSPVAHQPFPKADHKLSDALIAAAKKYFAGSKKRIVFASIGAGVAFNIAIVGTALFFAHHSTSTPNASLASPVPSRTPPILNQTVTDFIEAATQLNSMSESGVNFEDFDRQLIIVKAKWDLVVSTSSVPVGALDGFLKALEAWGYTDLLWKHKLELVGRNPDFLYIGERSDVTGDPRETRVFHEQTTILYIQNDFPDVEIKKIAVDGDGRSIPPESYMLYTPNIRILMGDASECFMRARQYCFTGK